MFKTSYLREVRKEKYEHSTVFEEPGDAEPEDPSCGSSIAPDWAGLQELNTRFAQYINRARVLEQHNAVFRKQLETLQHMEETAGLEEAFRDQINTNRQRIRDLLAEHNKLERQLKDAESMLDEFSARYKNECECQEQLRGILEQLNKEADAALLKNLEYQIECQFLQDDINSTRDRHKKNLAEIQTYVNILQQINQTVVLLPNMSVGISEEQERLLALRKVPALHSQLDEYKSALCQLQAQKNKLQTETSALEQTIKSTQESYDDEIQLYNEQIESLRKGIEETERLLEKYTSDCRQLAFYQTSLENELERYKRIIESEDNRLNSAIIGTPISLFTTTYKSHTRSPTMTKRGKDITQAIHDITNVKPRQKNLAKKVTKMKELTSKDVMESVQEDKGLCDHEEEEKIEVEQSEEEVKLDKHNLLTKAGSHDDVPDGAQISKAFDTLCNIVRKHMGRYKKPEPIADFITKGSYILVTGESSYLDPCFYTTTPSPGHVFVTLSNNTHSPNEPNDHKTPSPPKSPSTDPSSIPLTPPVTSDNNHKGKGDEGANGKGTGGKYKQKNGDPGTHKNMGPQVGPSHKSGNYKPKENKDWQWGPTPSLGINIPPGSMSYEKVEVVESVEKYSPDLRVKGYEETSMVVETMIEKTSKNKQGDRAT